jgi:hypothetical protein
LTAGRVIFGYRRTTGAVAGITASDWSFCLFENGIPTGAFRDWGIAVTVSGTTSLKETTANWGASSNYYMMPNTTYHLGLVVFQNGGSTRFTVYMNGIGIRGGTIVASNQTVDFVNSREVVFMAGYASCPTVFGYAQNAQMSNTARPQSYFTDAARRIL